LFQTSTLDASLVILFGTDSSLKTATGWDDGTGVAQAVADFSTHNNRAEVLKSYPAVFPGRVFSRRSWALLATGKVQLVGNRLHGFDAKRDVRFEFNAEISGAIDDVFPVNAAGEGLVLHFFPDGRRLDFVE
jgi:hypothetical protein